MINKEKIKIVIFDIDNTLSYGVKAREFYCQYSRHLEKVLAKSLKVSVVKAKQIADDYRSRYNGHGERSFEGLGIGMDVWFEGILLLNPKDYLEPLNYSNQLLKTLKDLGFIVGAITDGPRIQASRILETIQTDESFFDFIIGWEKGKKMPKYGSRQIYEEICEKYSVKPNEVVMVGDSLETDILPAKEVGLEVIHITSSEAGGQFKRINNIEELYRSLLIENNLK
jgi:FMN phosphatase YigB (HAD superfamily)